MLQLKDICKTYVTGDLKQTALDHVSLGLRDNEFVAILGQSGSGKTTMLNIIGGLDRYDSGDLIINQVSTKKYNDRDWDSYRNHSVGFVFQSYNLIPHQTILANVELALTISGISGSERTERALAALDQVGLKEQAHKKPNQLSGGQMQRVAIARALVNDPQILLADEPTGALDSETSIQVMELLKEVARDRLVVMVTHNPELAETYATRIVRLKDGVIVSDTDPVEVEDENAEHRNLGKASMSFLTALSLSFNNLKTKKARTILVAAAGSIGIIGIALILSLSNGVNTYIHDIEEETLSEYPLTIQSSSFDLASLLERRMEREEVDDYEVREMQMVGNAFSGVSKNDLKSLKEFFESGESGIDPYINALEYSYGLAPEIYIMGEDDSYRKVNPDSTFSSLGFGASTNSTLSFVSSTDVFSALPQRKSLYENQYDIKAGKWPENYNECVLVLTQSGGITDFALYAMGLKDHQELEDLMDKFAKDEEIDIPVSNLTFKYDEFVGREFKLVSNSDYYQYDGEYKIWKDKSEDEKYMKDLLNNKAETLTIVGVAKPKEDSSIAMLSPGICYPYELVSFLMDEAADSEIIAQQLSDSSTDVFTGKEFGNTDSSDFDMSSLFTVNEDAMKDAFKVDTNKLNLNFSESDLMGSIDLSKLNISIDNPDIDLQTLLSQVEYRITAEQMRKIFNELIEGYLNSDAGKEAMSTDLNVQQMVSDYIQNSTTLRITVKAFIEGKIRLDPDRLKEYFDITWPTDATKITKESIKALLLDPTADLLTHLTDEDIMALESMILSDFANYVQERATPAADSLTQSFAEYLQTSEAAGIILKNLDTDAIQKEISKISGTYTAAIEKQINAAMASAMTQVGSQMASAISRQMSGFAQQLPNAFSFDTEAFSNAFEVNKDPEEIQEIMMSLMTRNVSTYDNNLKKLGYATEDNPTMISIFPKDFESKEEVIGILDDYNERMKEHDAEDKTIIYTDMVGALMSSVTDIINTISYILIAFVAISLVVSSIMIGVITYISVLERKKEIGILRAIGASKRNISEVFNAETFIIGLLAGLIGIGTTLILLVPINAIVHAITGNPNVNAILPPIGGIALIIISVILTLIGGIIPSRKAAKSDPVEALRTE